MGLSRSPPLPSINIWFVCKLCRCRFQDVKNFIDHKKRNHFLEFQHAKCIVFEEAATDDYNSIGNEYPNSYRNFNDSSKIKNIRLPVQENDMLVTNSPKSSTSALSFIQPLPVNNDHDVLNSPTIKIENCLSPLSPFSTQSTAAAKDQDVGANKQILMDIPPCNIGKKTATTVTTDSFKSSTKNFASFTSVHLNSHLGVPSQNEITNNLAVVIKQEPEAESLFDFELELNESQQPGVNTEADCSSIRASVLAFMDTESDLSTQQNSRSQNQLSLLQQPVQAQLIIFKAEDEVQIANACATTKGNELLENYENQNQNKIQPFQRDETSTKSQLQSSASNSFVCGLCGSSFHSQTDLVSHLSAHSKTTSKITPTAQQVYHLNLLTCPHPGCSKTFSTKEKMRKHRYTHKSTLTQGTGDNLGLVHSERFQCPEDNCGKMFRSARNLRLHIEQVHSYGDRGNRFACHICSKTFLFKSILQDHLMVHSEDKPFHCPHPGCTSAYKRKREMVKHQRVHLKPKLKPRDSKSQHSKLNPSSKHPYPDESSIMISDSLPLSASIIPALEPKNYF